MTAPIQVGSVVSLWRYPVKSMMGEELNASEIGEYGLAGDRAYALIDSIEGRAASAKNPRRWPGLFDFRASMAGGFGEGAPAVRITLPDGTPVRSDQADIHRVLSRAVDREVTLTAATHDSSRMQAENYWPDIEGLDHRDTVTTFGLPAGTFFDAGVVHILTTSTIDRLRSLYPQGRFEVRRFRPNIVLETSQGDAGFVEEGWTGRTLAIGDVRLSIVRPCVRCVMTTLPQGDLPRDLGILRTVARHNGARVGVYASVLQKGKVLRGESVWLE